MNTFNKITLSIIAAASLLIAGCATPTQTQNAQIAVTMGAQLGTVIYLSKHPSDSSYFVGSKQVLIDLSTSTNLLDVATVNEALAVAHQTNSLVIDLVVSDAVNLGNIYIQNNLGTNVVQKSQSVKLVCGWLADGIGQGLVLSGK